MKELKEKIIAAFIFLMIFSVIHMASDFIKLRLPLLASSEAVWEHMKMGIYASTITYLIVGRIRKKYTIVGLSSFTLASVLSIFTYYYAVVSITGPLGKISFSLDLSVALVLTWLCGLTGAAIGFEIEKLESKWIKWFSFVNYLALILLSFATTYIGPPIPMFRATS